MNPYLSIVMGIGGNVTEDLSARLANSVMNLNALVRQTYLSMELLIVEWNTPRIGFRIDDPSFRIRVIHVPQELHKQVPNPHALNYFEWYPKNIGIRRAHGEFVLSTNPDDIFSKELFSFFSRRLLQAGIFYRVNRHDTIDGKVYRVCRPTGCFAPDATEEQIKVNHPNACPWSPDMIAYNAAGDFTLMSKEDWFKIHGNPEREYSHTIDGQTLWLAHLKGMKQILLPYPVFHPEHPRTLNIANGQFVGPEWDDNKPFTKENGEGWGFADMEFEETIL